MYHKVFMILHTAGALERHGVDDYTKTDGSYLWYFEQNVV